MNIASSMQQQMIVIRVPSFTIDGLRHLSDAQFRQFGVPFLAYLRPVADRGYRVHAADGSILGEVADPKVALELLGENGTILLTTQ
jgi:hypothetical protein